MQLSLLNATHPGSMGNPSGFLGSLGHIITYPCRSEDDFGGRHPCAKKKILKPLVNEEHRILLMQSDSSKAENLKDTAPHPVQVNLPGQLKRIRHRHVLQDFEDRV